MKLSRILLSAAITLAASVPFATHASADGPYKLLSSTKVGGTGGFDYVFADAASRHLFIPRGTRVTVFDLDSLKPLSDIADTKGVHGVAVDPANSHGFSSSNPVVMFDSKTLATIKTIDVKGNPDGILFEPATKHIWVLSHSQPNVTVINSEDGAIVGTIDLGGQPEQGASDGAGKVYVSLEDKDAIAVVDATAMKVTATYDLGGKTGGPAGLALDAKNHILFSTGRQPAATVILNADTGKIITSLPTGNGVDAAAFNPDTLEAFSSQGDGTLTVIKENSPTDFSVEQTVQTKTGAKTCTFDSATGHILLITADYAAPATQPAASQPAATAAANGGRPRRGRRQMLPDSFQILTVGK